MDQIWEFSRQQSFIKNEGQQIKNTRPGNTGPGSRNEKIQNQREDIKKVAREMESLFAYQLLKVMRETSTPDSTGNTMSGQDTYMSLFDMEVSRLFAERGLGLQSAIINWLDRSPDTYKSEGKDSE